VIVCGMLIGTFFTLFVLPTIYSLLARRHNQDAESGRFKALKQFETAE
jgi:multidrug efflux pump